MEASTSQMYWTIGAIVMAAVVVIVLVTWLPMITKNISTFMSRYVSNNNDKVQSNTDTAFTNAMTNTK